MHQNELPHESIAGPHTWSRERGYESAPQPVTDDQAPEETPQAAPAEDAANLAEVTSITEDTVNLAPPSNEPVAAQDAVAIPDATGDAA